MKFIIFDGRTRSKNQDLSPLYEFNGKVFSVAEPWFIIKNKIIRLICHAHLSSNINSKFALPFRSIWNKLLFKNIKDDDVCIIWNSHFYQLDNAGCIKYLRKRYKNCKIVFQFSDKYDFFRENYRNFPEPDELKEKYDLVITYNINDVLKYGFVWQRPCIGDYSNIENDETIPQSDLFFVGKNKGRLSKILYIYEFCRSNGLKCDFHVTDVAENEQKYKDNIKYNKPISYDEVLKRVKRTKCILNLVQDGGEGITMRDYEALGNNKYLLTDNKFITEVDFYDANQIILLEEFEKRIFEIKNNFLKENNFSNKYNRENYFQWLENLLK